MGPDRRRIRWTSVAAAWFLLLLSVPGVLALSGSRPRAVEKRSLAPWPGLPWHRFLDGDYYSALDRWAADRLPLRDRAIALQSRIDVDLLGESRPVLPGRKGWLFLGEELERACHPVVTPDAVVRGLARSTSVAEARHVPVVWMIVPDKATSLPSLVDGGPIGCALAGHRALQSAIDARPDLPIVFPNQELAAEVSRRGAAAVWWQGDSHQTSWGHLVEVRRALDLLAPGLYDARRARPVSTTQDADLWRLLGRPRDETVTGVEIRRPDVTTKSLAGAPDGSNRALRAYHSSGGRVVPGRTVVVCDSHFTGRDQGLLAPWFEDVTFIPWDVVDSPAARAALGGADRLVVETVEREQARLANRSADVVDALGGH